MSTRFKDLIQRHLEENLSETEHQELMQLIRSGKHAEELKQIISETMDTLEPHAALSFSKSSEIIKNIVEPQKKAKVVSLFRYRVAAVAATIALLAVVGYGTFQYFQSVEISTDLVAQNIKPGGDKAILTLADGSQVELNTIQTSIPSQGVAQITSRNGQLAYSVLSPPYKGGDAEGRGGFFNTVSTQRGGQYEVELSDGSKVWLNAVSSLRFPVAFSGTERVVELTGEAYFEIAKNEKMPFKVITPDGSEIKVLGTHFNVMAYAEEAVVKTTLLEGSVKVSPLGEVGGVILTPNQQAQISKTGELTILKNYNVNEAVAWKNGKFQFSRMKLPDIMRMVERWYDVKVLYEGDLSDITFSAVVSRDAEIQSLLNPIELTGAVHFEINGRDIIVRRGKADKNK